MAKMSVPPIVGYRAVTAHDCARCGQLIRVMYEAIPNTAPEREGKLYQMYREQRFAGGAMIVAWSHREADYSYYAHNTQNKGCGFVLASADQTPESYIQQMYQRLFVAPAKVTDRILRFDVSAFLASPLTAWADPRDPSQPRLGLVASVPAMRSILVTGVVPGVDGAVAPLDAKALALAPQKFLDLIKAETVKIQV